MDSPIMKKKRIKDGLTRQQRYYRKNKKRIAAKATKKNIAGKIDRYKNVTAELVFSKVKKIIYMLKLEEDSVLFEQFNTVEKMTFALIYYYILRILEKAAGNAKESFLQREIDLLYTFLKRLFTDTVPAINTNCEAIQEELFRNLDTHPVKLADCLGCLLALKQRYQ